MPLNIPGLLVPFQLLVNPRVVLPGLIVKDIRYIDFVALRKAGYRGAVFDKDNCITRPHKDTIVPEIQDAWEICRETFGEANVLIVSNSAGTKLDPGGIQRESVEYHTGVPVLQHKSLKPSYSCISGIRAYFSSLRFPIRDSELIIVGDRIFTDVVLANRMRTATPGLLSMAFTCAYENEGADAKERDAIKNPGGPLPIWTTGVWEKEAMVMRWWEKRLIAVVRRWTGTEESQDLKQFITEPIKTEPPSRLGIMAGLFGVLRQGRSRN